MPFAVFCSAYLPAGRPHFSLIRRKKTPVISGTVCASFVVEYKIGETD
jgi:hypothetical protein